MVKLVYVLLDGLGDRPHPDLNGLTPLEAAETPHLDRLAHQGLQGLVYPVGKGVSPESDVAVFHMLGYSFEGEYVGRGVVEAYGAGLELKPGDLALRLNFATIDDKGYLVDRRVGRSLRDEEAAQLVEALNREVRLDGATFQVAHTVGHRGVLVLKADDALSENISNTDPAYRRLGGMGVAVKLEGPARIAQATPLDDSEAARLSARLVNEFTTKALEVLRDHPVNRERSSRGELPANAVLLRDAGSRIPQLDKVGERYGLSFACLVDMPVERGIARLVGMEASPAGGLTDYGYKARRVLELLKGHDAVYVHIKGPDEPGHDGDARKKARVIEAIDRSFFGLLADLRPEAVVVAVSADHATPCVLKAHSDDPVPLVVSGGPVGRDQTCLFSEREAAKGDLGVLHGPEVLPRLVELMGRR
jgi:2,3-bisphosphoglycerate-independent phosphoglycerate mutase